MKKTKMLRGEYLWREKGVNNLWENSFISR